MRRPNCAPAADITLEPMFRVTSPSPFQASPAPASASAPEMVSGFHPWLARNAPMVVVTAAPIAAWARRSPGP